MSVHLSNTDLFLWIFSGAVIGLCIYLMGYFMGRIRTTSKLRQTRGQLELDDDDIYGKELKIKYVEPEKNNSEKD